MIAIQSSILVVFPVSKFSISFNQPNLLVIGRQYIVGLLLLGNMCVEYSLGFVCSYFSIHFSGMDCFYLIVPILL